MKRFRHSVEAVAVDVVRAVVRVAPVAVVRLMGATLGLAFYVIDAPHRRVALANLAQCFPARTVAERYGAKRLDTVPRRNVTQTRPRWNLSSAKATGSSSSEPFQTPTLKVT